MTATKVKGLDVIAVQQVRSPLWTEERPLHYKSSVQLLLEDGSTTYGCTFCDYVSEKLGQVRHHQVADCLNNPKPSAKVRGEQMRGVAPARTHPTSRPSGLAAVGAAVAQEVKTKKKVAPPAEEDINPEDLMAALELALSAPKDDEEKARLRDENKVLTAERDWWKEKYMTLNQLLTSVQERLADR